MNTWATPQARAIPMKTNSNCRFVSVKRRRRHIAAEGTRVVHPDLGCVRRVSVPVGRLLAHRTSAVEATERAPDREPRSDPRACPHRTGAWGHSRALSLLDSVNAVTTTSCEATVTTGTGPEKGPDPDE